MLLLFIESNMARDGKLECTGGTMKKGERCNNPMTAIKSYSTKTMNEMTI